jgi:FkbM family methyltransferase
VLRCDDDESLVVTTLENGVRVAVLCDAEIETKFIADEIFADRCYADAVDGLGDDGDDPLIVDCGANVGLFSVWLSREPLAASRRPTILAFEPNPPTHRALARNLQRHLPPGSFEARRLALTSAAGRATMECYPRAPGNSTLRPKEKRAHHGMARPEFFLGGATTVEVETTTLDDALAPMGDRRVALLKIDVEGAELDVLKGGKRALQRTDRCVIEVCDVDGRLGQVTELLTNAGFDKTEARAGCTDVTFLLFATRTARGNK